MEIERALRSGKGVTLGEAVQIWEREGRPTNFNLVEGQDGYDDRHLKGDVGRRHHRQQQPRQSFAGGGRR